MPLGACTYSIESAAGSRWYLRRDLHDHLVLIVRRIDLRHLTGAVRGVERGLDLIDGQTEGGDLVAIEIHRHLRVLDLQILTDVLNPLDVVQRGLEQRRDAIELVGVGPLERELILRCGSAWPPDGSTAGSTGTL